LATRKRPGPTRRTVSTSASRSETPNSLCTTATPSASSKAHEHLAGYSVERGIEGSKRISFIGDEIEALVQLGELEAASARADELERRGQLLRRPTLTATAQRCQGLLLGASGDPDRGIALIEQALATFVGLGLPFERGRTLLALGEVHRRAKHKRAGREALEAAWALFDELGASIWAANARGELARIGGRVSAGELTPTERRVAELVAAGRSNKEVAGELFVTVRAVEANLSRVYAKLGIRSRTELVRRL
jgi:DNA-binding CsgD family transcriptional regulator